MAEHRLHRLSTDGTDETDSFDGAHAELTERIIGCAYNVHNELGPGFIEAIYENALAVELEKQGIHFKRQVPVNVFYSGRQVGMHRLDLTAEDKVIVELKAKDSFSESDEANVLSYLKATGFTIALLLNFGTPSLKIKRLGLDPRWKSVKSV